MLGDVHNPQTVRLGGIEGPLDQVVGGIGAELPLRAAAPMDARDAGSSPKDLVLLTATPVNNTLWDLYYLLAYFIKNDATFADVRDWPSPRQPDSWLLG